MLLEHALRRERWQKYIASLLLMAGAGLTMQWAWAHSGLFLVLLGASLFLLGGYYAYRHWPLRPLRHPLLDLLRHRPEDIVWVYSIVTQRLPFGLQFQRKATLYFKLVDRGEHTVSLSAKQAKAVSESLNARLPHATFGYSQEREQWYMASPLMLLRGEGG